MTLQGKWRIVELPGYEAGYVDMVGPAYILFGPASGEFAFGCVTGSFAGGSRHTTPSQFDWDGNDEMDEACGDGWAELEPDGSLVRRNNIPPRRRNPLHRRAVADFFNSLLGIRGCSRPPPPGWTRPLHRAWHCLRRPLSEHLAGYRTVSGALGLAAQFTFSVQLAGLHRMLVLALAVLRFRFGRPLIWSCATARSTQPSRETVCAWVPSRLDTGIPSEADRATYANDGRIPTDPATSRLSTDCVAVLSVQRQLVSTWAHEAQTQPGLSP